MLVSSRMAEAPDRIDVTTMQADPTTGTPQRHMVMSVDESGEWAARPLDWSTRNSSRQQTFDLYHGGTPDQSPEGKRQALALEGLAKRQAIANGPLVFMPAAGAPQLRDPNFDYERLRDENYVMGATRQTGVVLDRSALDKLWFKVSTFVGADTPLEAPLLGPADTELDAQIGTFDTDVEYRGDFSKAPVIGRVLMGMRLTTDDNGRVLVRRNIYGDDVQNPYNSEPIDYAKFDTDTIFFTPTQVDGLPSGTLENEGKLADAAGKRLAVLENNGNIVPWNAYVHPVPRPDAEGWAGPAPYAPQGNMANGYSNYVRFTIDRNHRLGGPTVEEELPRLRELRDTATDRMYVRVPTEALPGIVKSKGLKNQHQSRASGGYFSPKVRREGEATLFGLPEEGGFPTKDRPISGFVSTSADQGLTRYGNFAIKIKPETANRTTITFGDSLTVAAPMFEYARKPDGMRGKQEVGFVPERHGIALPLLGPVDDNQLLAASEVSYIRGLDAEYIELQFHGGVSFSDMEAVEYHTPTFFVGREPMDPAQTAAEVNSDLVAYAASPIPGLPLRLDDFAAENVTPETTQALADAGVEVLTGGGEGPMLVSSRMAEAPVKVNDGLPSVTNIEPVSRDELNDDEVLKQSWRQPFAEDNRRLSRELGEARMAGLRRAPIIVSADAIEYRPGQGIPMNQSADATFAAPGYSYPQLSRDAAVNPRGFGYVLGPSALADVAVTPGVDLPPEIGLTDPNPSDDLLIQMGWHDGSTDAFYRGKMPPDDVRGIVLLTGPAPIAASGQEPRWRLQDSSYPAYEGDGRYDTTWPPIDYEMLPGDTVFLSAVQATDNPEQTRREMAIAAAAGKGMKVLRNNGDIVDVEQVLAEYETAKVATPDDWTGPVPLKPEGNEGNRHAEFVRRIFDDAGLARPGRAPYTFSRNHDWYAGGRAHAEDADKFVTEMRDVRDGAEDRMVIRVPLEVIPLLIEDGRLKNQHESKQSEGTLDPRQRKDAERLLFGIPTRGGKVKDRPIYGLVETDGYRDGAQYGKFVISLKPETARRTTMTFGDSLGVANATYGYNTQDGVRKSKKKDEPDLRSAHGAAIPMTGDVSDEQILGATQANASNRAYVEIQVHGGVTLDDMRSVRYSPWIQNDDSTRADLLEYAKNPIPGLPLELPQDVYDIAGPEVIDALTGAGVTVVAVAPTGVGAL